MYTHNPLPRRPFLGLELRARRTDADDRPGIEVVRVTPGGAGANAGVRPGDRIQCINELVFSEARELGAYIKSLPAQTPLSFLVERDGQTIRLEGSLVPLPVERLAHADVHLDSLDLGDHRRRIVLTTPLSGKPPYPAILYLQGLGSQSVELSEDPDEPLRKLLEGFSEAGFATLRVERSGLGDSEGPAYATTNLFDDVRAYRAALDFPAHHPLVGNVVLFGHSVGGMIAPLLVGDGANVKGVIVFGTSSLSWVDCIVRATRRQKQLGGMAGEELEDYVSAWAFMHTEVCRHGYVPEQVFARFPGLRWIEGSACRAETMFGRHASFFQQLERLNLSALWKTGASKVLVMHGEFDWACGVDEGRGLAETIAADDPHRVKFIELPGCGHDMRTHASIGESYANPRRGVWDERIVRHAVDWLHEVCP